MNITEEEPEYMGKMKEHVEENPDLPLSLLKEILLGLDQLKLGEGVEYTFDK